MHTRNYKLLQISNRDNIFFFWSEIHNIAKAKSPTKSGQITSTYKQRLAKRATNKETQQSNLSLDTNSAKDVGNL